MEFQMTALKSTILIVEDDYHLGRILKVYFENAGFEVQIVNNGLEALSVLRTQIPNLIISDIMMPSMDGMSFRNHLLQDARLRMIPFVFLTAKGALEDKVTGLKMYVDDYITKPFEEDELIARIHSILGRHKRYADLIRYDSLTKIFNRRTIEELLINELSRVKRYRLKCSVLLLDIDRFKYCNDTFGHQFGDHVIMIMAETLIAQLRDVDYAGRLGGDEFLVIMPETDRKSCFLVAERLRLAVSHIKFDGKDFQMSISGGITSAPDDGHDIKTLLFQADVALYEAKNRGRNCIISCAKETGECSGQPETIPGSIFK
jgi:diguanylate cyclase (GGDEF)-like protein